MFRRIGASLVFLAFSGLGLTSCVQMVAAPNPAPIILGPSAVPLYGPWKFSTGDSPINPRTGAQLWAEPGFDDSKWETVDLTPRPGKVDPWTNDQRFVPGWTSLGHPGYMGWAWYRITMPIVSNKGERLALEGPYEADDAYQVFDNGELLGGFGKFGGIRESPVAYYNEPAMFLLPPETAGNSTDRGPFKHTLAFRVWMGPVGLLHSFEPGGLHYAPILGGYQAVAAQNRLDWLELILANCFPMFAGALLLLLGIVAVGLIFVDRSDPAYAWVAGILLLGAGRRGLDCVASVTQWGLSARADYLMLSIYGPLQLWGWMMVWWVWFRLRRPAWLPRAVAALTLAYMITETLGEVILPGMAPHLVGVVIQDADTAVGLSLVALLIFILVRAIQEYGWAGWLVVPAVLPVAMGQLTLEVQGLIMFWHPFGITVYIGDQAEVFMAVAISLLLLHRLLLSIRRQKLMAIDVKQAQEVQQVILPESRTLLPGLVIESEYRPAREVGGDFFQIIPNQGDGGVLIVAGDVAGKGLKAGMLVALLVGAIRSTTDLKDDPEFVLRGLNRRLLGRADAAATCLALRIRADGEVTLANSGHPIPYLNGAPLDMEGALPLGIVEGAEPSLMRFRLKDGDRLILMSDGIVEATDENGQLYGFDRVHELLHTATTAAEVAIAAQSFGQEDDISVISVTRTAALEPAAS